ncbi:hypothetical protein [Pectobacterium fontis]|uniref:Glycosyl transferase n=1 Tax=Pectobacterium fontis TaxID=2558042 RepID=A0A7V8IJS7_9GAMM|nr:hypothetical protein [Pectobacterium fontis]KHN53077.1 hypothetical protein OI69_06985 [Pectobacterium fontis]
MKTLFYTLAFGKQEYYLQSQLLIISFLKNRVPDSIFRLYTDKPGFFDFLADEIEIFPIDKKYLQECIGAHKGYVFSVKLNLIKRVAMEKDFDATVFLDTDVVAYQSLSSLVSTIYHGGSVMYQREKKYSRESKKEYWNALCAIDTLEYRVDITSSQWNSGVVGLPQGWENKMQDASVIMDELHEYGVKQHTLEQVAISVVLESTGNIHPATDSFIHYYANKCAWEGLCDELEKLKNSNVDVCHLIDWFGAIKTLPAALPDKENIFYRLIGKWKKSIQKRLLLSKK